MNRYYYLLIFMSLLTLHGCGIVMTAVNTARGGDSDFYIIESVQDFRSFNSVNLNQFTGEANERLTPELLTYMNNEIQDGLTENGVELSKDGQLRISGSVIYFVDSFGSKQILVEVKLDDSATDHSLGTVNVIGQALGLRGIESAADAVAEGITELLVTHNFPGIES